MSFFDPIEFGAKADGSTSDTRAIQSAVDAAFNNGGGIVLFRSGKTYVSGSLVLKSNVTLHLEQGSLLKCSTNWADITELWPGGPQKPTHWEQIHSGIFLTAKRGTHNVAITGLGTIDGSGEHYRGPDRGTTYEVIDNRPFLLFFVGVVGVTIKDATFRESAFWTIRLSGCEDVLITGARIRGNLRMPNCDGIDLDRCRRCRVSDCDIICADDGVSIKGCREFADFGAGEDIVVTNCTIVTKSSALVVGVEANAPLRNITFSNCVIRNSNRGLSVNLGEDSVFENITFSNIFIETRVWGHQWWGRGEPIYVSVTPWTNPEDSGIARNIRFNNITCRSECGVYIAADRLGQAENIFLDNISVQLGPWSGSSHPEEQGGFYDRRPTCGDREIYKPEEGIAAFHLENVQGARLTNCTVSWAEPEGSRSDWLTNGLWARGCKDLYLSGFGGTAAKAGLDAVDIS